jgi:hypothetical protein
MSNFESLTDEDLTATNGGATTWRYLSQFAQQHGFHVTSAMGGHHLGWAHKAGHAVDVRTRGMSSSAISHLMRDARAHGITVIDERHGGNRAWTGAHIHLQK